MKEIKNFLEKQAELSNELTDILYSFENISSMDIERFYADNKESIDNINKRNKKNSAIAKDKLDNFKNKVDILLARENTDKDSDFKEFLLNLKTEANYLSNRLESLNYNLDKMSQKHNEYIEKVNSKDLNNASEKAEEIVKIEKPKYNYSNYTKVDKEEINNKLEFKFNFEFDYDMKYMLTTMLIAFSFVALGGFVYTTNYLNDVTKGIILFIISALVLGLGEFTYMKKSLKSLLSISGLGIGCLYLSLFINYAIFNTMDSIATIILTIIIFAISMFISRKHNFNIIRVFGLIGGYSCLMSLSGLNITESYIVVILLLAITISNICVPIKNNNFIIYSSIAMSLTATLLRDNLFANSMILAGYIVISLIINNFNYIKSSKRDGYNSKQHLFLFLTSMYLIILLSLKVEYILVPGFVSILISLISYVVANNKLKSAFYCHCLYLIMTLIFTQSLNLSHMYNILIAILIFLTLHLTAKNDKDYYMIFVSILIVMFGFRELLTISSPISMAIYSIMYIVAILEVSKKHKDNILVILLKHGTFSSIMFFISTNNILDFVNTVFFLNVIATVYIFMISHIDRLKDKYFKTANKYIIFITLLTTVISGWVDIRHSLTSIAISLFNFTLLTNPKYVKDSIIAKHKMVVGSSYLNYIVAMFAFALPFGFKLNNLILSVVVAYTSIMSIWIGFESNKSALRRYGYVTFLIICAKLIYMDLYMLNNTVFSIWGLIIFAVAITVTYFFIREDKKFKDDEYIEENKYD